MICDDVQKQQACPAKYSHRPRPGSSLLQVLCDDRSCGDHHIFSISQWKPLLHVLCDDRSCGDHHIFSIIDNICMLTYLQQVRGTNTM